MTKDSNPSMLSRQVFACFDKVKRHCDHSLCFYSTSEYINVGAQWTVKSMPNGCFHKELESGTKEQVAFVWKRKTAGHHCQPDLAPV